MLQMVSYKMGNFHWDIFFFIELFPLGEKREKNPKTFLASRSSEHPANLHKL